MADKNKLNDMLDSLIDDNAEQAQVHFHDYLEDKMKEVLHPEIANADAEVVDDESGDKKD